MLKLWGVLTVTAALGVLAAPQPGLQAAEPSPRALVVINGYDHNGQYLETSNGFVVAGGFLFASFQAIHHAAMLEVEDGLGNPIQIDGWVYANADQDVVILVIPWQDAFFELAPPSPLKLGEPLEVFGFWDEPRRIAVAGESTAKIEATDWHHFEAELPWSIVGAPLLNDQGLVRGMYTFGMGGGSRDHYAAPGRILFEGLMSRTDIRPLAELECVPTRYFTGGFTSCG